MGFNTNFLLMPKNKTVHPVAKVVFARKLFVGMQIIVFDNYLSIVYQQRSKKALGFVVLVMSIHFSR